MRIGKRAVVRLVTTRLATAVVLILLAVPFATSAAQPSERVPRVGALWPNTRAAQQRTHDAFLQGLQEHGWVDGKNVVIEYRWAEGRPERLPELAAELVRLKVVNLKTAKALGLTIPRSVLLRADQLIE